MNKIDDSTFFNPTANTYVESALRYVGYARNTCGYLPHSLVVAATEFVYFFSPSFAERLLKMVLLATRNKLIEGGLYTPAT